MLDYVSPTAGQIDGTMKNRDTAPWRQKLLSGQHPE